MSIDGRKLPFGMQIYTHVDDDGVNTHIASVQLREWCLKHQPEIFWTPVAPHLAMQFLQNNTVSKARVLSMKPEHANEPILYCKDGTFTNGLPDVFLVDGHHRFVRAALLRQAMIEAWVLDEAQWRPFQIVNFPDTTQEALAAEPVRRRKYWK